MLGSWNFALTYELGDWRLRAYLEHYFEDHSQMFWEYGRWKDGQLGLEVTLPRNRWVSKVLWEGLATKDQAGPILYDGFWGSFQDIQVSGCDNYYNHYIYQAWQHAGMAMGNPLLTSPAYNEDGSITFKSNRVRSNHLGLTGEELAGIGLVYPALGNLCHPAGQTTETVQLTLGGHLSAQADGGMALLGGLGPGSGQLYAGQYGGRHDHDPQDGIIIEIERKEA